jgi:hypothetical protein
MHRQVGIFTKGRKKGRKEVTSFSKLKVTYTMESALNFKPLS